MSENTELQEKEREIREFLETKKILILDASANSHSGLYQVLQDLGAKNSNIFLANTFNEGCRLIESEKPHILVTEYEVGTHNGFELLPLQRAQHTEGRRDTLVIMVTSNVSQKVVVQAAEEDVDAFVVKPYQVSKIRTIFFEVLARKIRPPQYNLVIEEGKALLEAGHFKEADEKFQKAITLDVTPSLAHYYLGYSKYLQTCISESKTNYEQGLKFNEIHYKCLVGMYNLLISEKENEKAYQMIRKISAHFPASSQRLGELLRLAVLTGHFQDVEEYYRLFEKMGDQNEELSQHVCAALVVCGKYCLGTPNTQSKALDFFRKAAVAGRSKSFFLREMVLTLLEHDLSQAALEFLQQFLPMDQKSSDFLVCQFLVKSKTGLALSAAIEEGQTLLGQGIVSRPLFHFMIRALLESQRRDAAEDLVKTAIKKFPDDQRQFELLFNQN